MKNRHPAAVFLLPFITFGIYGIYWSVKTKGEMVALGADIPTAWLIIVPIANIWWMWKYAEGVEKVTNGKMQGVIAFILLVALGSIGSAVVQDSFNKLEAQPVANVSASKPAAPTATEQTPPPASPEQ